MKAKVLKATRILLASFFFAIITAVFLDFTGFFPPGLIRGVLWMQFVPSLLQFSRSLAVASGGFLVVLAITILFGRLYCSTICPLGILQDLIRAVGRLLGASEFNYHKPLHKLRAIVVGVVLLAVVTGSVFALNLVAPYSLFGRISQGLLRPILLAVNNQLASILQRWDIYSVSRVNIIPLHWSFYALTVFFLGVIGLLAARHGRLFCNTLCPVGTVLGCLSRFSIFKVRFREDRCTGCGACAKACKAECINVEERRVDQSRCVSCFNCLTACNSNAISFETSRGDSDGGTEKAEARSQRREAMNLMLGGLLLGSIAKPADDLSKTGRAQSEMETRSAAVPPGATGVQQFLRRCTACHLCVSECPTGVIQPSTNEFGWSHVMQVRMDFQTAYCNYECTRCTDVCPTGALDSLIPEDKKRTQIGKANFIKENCIVISKRTACGACAEHCPTGALNMVLYENHLTIPEVDQDVCIGCGACEHICPARPSRAIYVDGNVVHVTAKKRPAIADTDDSDDEEEDFPF